MKYTALIKVSTRPPPKCGVGSAVAVYQALILRNRLIGELIRESEHHGKDRAENWERLPESLAKGLSIIGLKFRNLRNCRRLHAAYSQIRQTLSAVFPNSPDTGHGASLIPAKDSSKPILITQS